MGGSSKRVTVGYKYYLGVHFALCHGVVDSLIKIRVDKRVAIEQELRSGSLFINNPNLFGGEKREGGVVGTVDLLNGTRTQGVNSYLASRLPAPVPAFRGICSLILRQVYIGVNPYLKNWAITIKRIHKKSNGELQWNNRYAEMSINPATEIENIPNNATGLKYLQVPLADTADYSDPSFNDSAWATGQGPFGNAASAPPSGWPIRNTEWDSGSSLWVRTTFDLTTYDIDFTFQYSLGGAFYINGNLLTVSNGVTLIVPESFLVDGTNYLAFKVNDTAGTSYFAFKSNKRGVLDGTMNPSHIIRECLTDSEWGCGYTDAEIGDSFESAALTLYNENFGLSTAWTRQTPVEDFINTILQTIEGTLYVSRTTGKWELTLARADYDIEDLFVIDETIINRVTNFKRKSPSELVNQVSIQFDDYSTGEKNSVTAQNIALIQQFGTIIAETYEYTGVTTAELATKLAARELKAMSQPLIGCTVYTTREASFLNVGEVFILSYARSGIAEVVMRVVKIDLGSFDNGTVKIDCIQDVFGASATVYAPSEGGEWENPATEPVDLTFPLIYEAPYYELAQIIGDDDAQALPVHSGYVVLSGVAPSGDSFNMSIYNNIGLDFEEAGTADFCPSGVLVDVCGYLTYTILIDGVVDIDVVQTGTYALLGAEIVRVDSMPVLTSDGYEVTIARGCLDTVRTEHAIATRIYFSDAYVGSDQVEYVDSETPNFKLTPITSKGELPVDDATAINVTMNSRKDRPYPPAKVQINAISYPDTILATDELVLTWVERNRIQQTASIVDDLEGTITPEANITYQFELYNSINVLIHSHYNIIGTSSTVTIGQLGTDYGILRIVLWCERDDGSETFESWQRHDFTIERLT